VSPESSPESQSKPKTVAWVGGLVGSLALLACAAVWFIRRERRRTRAATAEFARQMDEEGVRRRLARMFGYDEPRPRLREFLLRPGAARRRDDPPRSSPSPPQHGSPPRTPPPKKMSFDEQWVTPPPPYAPRRTSSPGFEEVPLEPLSLPPPPRTSPGRIRIPDPNLTVRAGLADAVPLSPEAIRELGELWPHLGRRYSHGIV
jgi:hypothetical protein